MTRAPEKTMNGQPGRDRRERMLLFFLVATLTLAAPLDLSQWKYRKKIPLTPGGGLAAVRLDRDIFATAGTSYFVLRIVRDGNEVPFVLDTPGWEGARVSGESIFDETVVPGVGLQFTLHEKGRAKHHSVLLLTSAKNFRSRVRIETSEDGRRWGIARQDGAIFNFSQDGREFESLDVGYPVSSRPFLRVTIFGWTKTGTITGAFVSPYIPPDAEVFEPIATLTPRVSEDSATKSTLVQVDLGAGGLNTFSFIVETPSPQFQRAVETQSSSDGVSWTDEVSSTIARLPGPAFTEERLTIQSNSQRRYYRFRIYNRDDAPIRIDRIRVEGPVRVVRFLAPDAGSYWLYYGNPAITTAPSYDLAQILARQQLAEHSWTLGPQEPNPLYRPPFSKNPGPNDTRPSFIQSSAAPSSSSERQLFGLHYASAECLDEATEPSASAERTTAVTYKQMPRYFTVDQAQHALPEVETALRDVLFHRAEYQKAHEDLENNAKRIRMSGGSRVDPSAHLAMRARRDTSASALKDAAGRVEQAGALIKDVETGLIDFLSRYKGEEVCLCWKLGEGNAIRFWHGLDEGFRGRKPIDDEFMKNHRGEMTN